MLRSNPGRSLAVTLVLFLATLSCAHAAASGWEWTGGPGGSTVMAMETTPRGTLLAGLENGGLFRSTDGGLTWSAPSDGLNWPCCNYNIRALAASEAAVYAGTWGGGVRRSDDDGETWFDCGTIPGEGYPIVMSLAACRYGDRLYAGGNFGVVRSDDAGMTWTELDAGLPASWVRGLALRGTTLYALTDNGLYRHPDGATGWEPWNDGLPETGGMQSLTVTADALFLSTHVGGIFRLGCNDSSWVALNADLWDDHADALVEVDQTLYTGTMGSGVFRFDPGSMAWEWIGSGLWGRDVRSMTARGVSPMAGTFGAGVFGFDPESGAWTERNVGLVAPSVLALAVDGSTLYSASSGDGIWRSLDSGTIWTHVGPAFPERNIFDLAVSGGRVFAGSWDGVWYSEDQGWNWQASGLQGHGVFSLRAAAGVLYAGTWDGQLWLSTDNGDTWSQPGSGLPNAMIPTIAIRPAGIYVAVSGSGVHHLPTSATEWVPWNDGLPPAEVNVLVASDAGLLAGLDGYGVYRWNETLGAWEATALNTESILEIHDAGNELLAGGWGTLHRSSDGGASWVLDADGLKPWLPVRALASGGGWLFAGLDAGGVWRQSGGTTGAALPPPTPAALTLQVTPNPTGRASVISFTLVRSGRVELTVHDVAGRLVGTLLSDTLPAGPHDMRWPVPGSEGTLTAGLYFIRLKVDARELTVKALRLD